MKGAVNEMIIEGRTVHKEAWTLPKGMPSRIGFSSQKKKDEDNFYAEMRPLLWMLRIIGRITYEIADDGRMRFRLLSKWSVYFVTVYSAQCYLVAENILHLIGLLSNPTEPLTQQISFTFGLVFMLLHFTVVISTLTEWDSLADYFNQWKEFQVNYKTMTGEALSMSMGRTIRVIEALLMPAVVYITYLEFGILGLQREYQLIPYIIVFLASNLYLEFWVVNCLELENASNQIKKKIVQVLQVRGCSSGVWECRQLWLGLSSMCQSLGSGFCCSITTLCLTCAASVVVSSFIVLTWIFGSLTDAQTFLLVLSLSSVYIFVICEGGHRVTQKVGIDFVKEILRKDTASMDEKSALELDRFFTEISIHPPTVTFGGFVTVNRSLVLSIASNVVTYLIVLVQLIVK